MTDHDPPRPYRRRSARVFARPLRQADVDFIAEIGLDSDILERHTALWVIFHEGGLNEIIPKQDLDRDYEPVEEGDHDE